MRSFSQKEIIRETKSASSVEEKHFVLETPKQREFFRYDMGRLVEYEMTKANYKPIKFKPEEIEGEADFEFSEL